MEVQQAAGANPAARSKGMVRRGDWPTLALFAGCLAVWIAGLMLALSMPGLGFILVTFALVLHSSLTHEILHGHPFESDRAGTVLGAFQPGIAIPYMRFKRLHLAHHRDANLTDPYDDPEANYLDPAVWDALSSPMQRVLMFNNTLVGRMLVGPLISQWVFVKSDATAIWRGDREVLGDWLLHIPGLVVTLWVVTTLGMPVWLYLLACYAALSILKIRTFLEHQAHARASGRTVIIEDRGLLAFLFLNNNFHAVHHKHPGVAWYQLPGLYRAQRERFVKRNHGYVYRSYGQIFRTFLWRRKDPVAHPLWQGRGE